MADNVESILGETRDNLREATQRLRATESRMLAAGMHDQPHYRDLFVRVSTALGRSATQPSEGSPRASNTQVTSKTIVHLGRCEAR